MALFRTDVIDNICGRIAKERPELPIFTIHDSITSTVGNEEYIQRIMTEELILATGMKPHLVIEYWNSEEQSTSNFKSTEIRMLDNRLSQSA